MTEQVRCEKCGTVYQWRELDKACPCGSASFFDKPSEPSGLSGDYEEKYRGVILDRYFTHKSGFKAGAQAAINEWKRFTSTFRLDNGREPTQLETEYHIKTWLKR